MKKILITGITGFAGSHLAEFMVSEDKYTIWGTHISDRNLQNLEKIREKIELLKLDLVDASKVAEIIESVKPDIIFHLAAFASVGQSFQKPLDVFINNTAAELNVLEGAKKAKLSGCKILVTSSAQVYGFVSEKDLPITEQAPFKPNNPYSVSKITQDYLALQYFLEYKLSIVRLRPFNHLGPRLSAEFSIARFAKDIARIEKGLIKPTLTVGNMATKRDFTDVRDMVQAYVKAADKCIDGEAYNIGSGTSYSMQEMLDKLLSLATVKISVEQDQSLFRPSDIPELRCDATKFRQVTGWKPEIPIEKTLQDTLDYWRSLV